MPTRLIILRHGETVYNLLHKLQGQSDSPLTETGIEQIQQAGKKLTQVSIDSIYISSLHRTIQTYEVIKPFIKTKPLVHLSDQLVERSFGKGEGLTLDQALEWYPEVKSIRKNTPYEWKFPGGESYKDLRKRTTVFIDEILQEHQGKNILLITHGGVAKILLIHYQHIPLSPWPDFIVPNAAINILSFSDQRNKVTWEQKENAE